MTMIDEEVLSEALHEPPRRSRFPLTPPSGSSPPPR